MAIVPGSTRRTVQERGTAVRSRTANISAASQGALEGELAQGVGQVLQQQAEKEIVMREQQALLDMKTQVVDFDAQFDKRLEEIKQEDIGDRDFSEVVMEDFDARRKEFLENQPEFTKGAAALSLLGSQARVAKLALAEQNARFNQKVEDNANSFVNNVRNNVEFGGQDPFLAMQQLDSFMANVPENFQESIRTQAEQQIRQGQLGRAVSQDPVSALAAIQNGEYNDVDTKYVRQQFQAANTAVLKQKTEVDKLFKEANKYRRTDPARAARALLKTEGVERPNLEQLSEAQTRLGIPAARQNFITKDQSDEAVAQLSSASNVDDFFRIRDALMKGLEADAGSQEQIIQDMQELSDMHPALSSLIAADRNVDDPRFVATALELVRDNKAGEKAQQNILAQISSEDRPEFNTHIDSIVSSALEDQYEVMAKAGSSPADINRLSKTVKDMAAIVYSETLARNGGDLEAAKLAAEQVVSQGVVSQVPVSEGNDAILLPAEVADVLGRSPGFRLGRSLSETVALNVASSNKSPIADMRESIVEQSRLFIPPTYPDDESGRKDIMEKAGWAMSGPRSITLRMGDTGQPVFLKSPNGDLVPAVLSFADLRELANIDDPNTRKATMFRMIERDMREGE